MLHIVTFKTGDKYSADFVNRLYAMCRRRISIPFDFTCYTDDPAGIHPLVIVKEPPVMLPGWWIKLNFFGPDMPEGDRLLLDLDQVFTGELDRILMNAPAPVACSADPFEWHGIKFGSAFVLVRGGAYRHILPKFLETYDPSMWERLDELFPAGDQHYLSTQIPDWKNLSELFPGYFLSFKEDCQKDVEPPSPCRVVNFHGNPKQDLVPFEWVDRCWSYEY